MARYFLHLHECGTVITDTEGIELADLCAARIEAIKAARGVMCAQVEEGALCLSCRIIIEDKSGGEVGRVLFRDVVTVSGI
jgi:hypothetical protein